jgi:hypothetical protein
MVRSQDQAGMLLNKDRRRKNQISAGAALLDLLNFARPANSLLTGAVRHVQSRMVSILFLTEVARNV